MTKVDDGGPAFPHDSYFEAIEESLRPTQGEDL